MLVAGEFKNAVTMIYWNKGLFLRSQRLALDVTRRQPCGFISHAHADHIGPHELALCTPATARLYRHRCGDQRAVRELPYSVPFDMAGSRLTTYPAGHILGSAMLLVDDGTERLLYTGDFKLGPSATAEPAVLPRADTLVLECTYGDPKYRLPPRDEVIQQFLSHVRNCLRSGRTPIVHAYVLGKAQEITKILTNHGIRVQQHPMIHDISQIYQALGCDLGDVVRYRGAVESNCVIIAPPRRQKAAPIEGADRPFRIALSGWAMQSSCRYRMGVDVALPLSDHADHADLWQAVSQVQPQKVLCTHGKPLFVELLRKQGVDAEFLGP